MARDINPAGYALIRQHEGLRLKAYDDLQPNVKLTAATRIKGTLTIGIGHTGSLAAIGREGDVAWNTRITESQAERLFRDDIDESEADVERAVTVPVNENEFSALVSFAYNCGAGNLRKLVSGRLNRGDRQATAQAFGLYNTSKGKVLPGLTRRRADEAALFLKPVRTAARQAAKQAATQTPDDVAPRMSGDQKAAAGVAGGGVVAGGAASLWESAVGALKETSDWTWGLPETLGTAVIVGAVGVAVWLWWRRRRAAKAG